MPSHASFTPDSLLLALNSGSSSLKLGLYRAGSEDVELVASGSAEGIGRGEGSVSLRSASGEVLLQKEHLLESQQDALAKLTTAMRSHVHDEPAAVGHRFVHGGPHLREHEVLTPAVRAQLQDAVHFAPLHIPLELSLVEQIEPIYPSAVQVACFDTAFHRTLPPVACHLPLPPELYAKGIVRYGFHGLSYESIVYRMRDAIPHKAVFAHLGNGSSLAAVFNGKSIDTTMGLTPTGGIPMSTRSGDLDPGVMLYLMRNEQATADSLEAMLNQHAGLAALSGGESDMQALLQRTQAGDESAALAVDVFCTAVTKTIGSYAALLGGLDLVVFTGGIGEHSAEIRQRVCQCLHFLGLSSGKEDSASVRILPAEEEKQIARHCRGILSAQGSSPSAQS